MSFATRLKEARENKNLTQKKLAELVGVRNTAISNYEKAVSFPNIDILYKIFDILQIEPNFFFQDDIQNLALTSSYNLTDIQSPSEVDPDMFILHMYKQLDTEDKAEIRGEMKQMLKADKYSDNEKDTKLKHA